MGFLTCGIFYLQENLRRNKLIMSNIKYMEVKTNKDFKNIFFVAYDMKEEKYVGVLSLLHTPLQYEEVTLKAAEYAIAGTLEEYPGPC